MGPEALAKPEVAQLVQQPLFACLATVNSDGTPHQTYVWYKWTGREFLISTTKDRVKYRNLARDPRAGLSVFDPGNPYRFVSLNGPVTVSTDGANDLIVELAVHYMGEQRGRRFAQQYAGPDRVILHLTPGKVLVYGF